jgi:ribonuclease Z
MDHFAGFDHLLRVVLGRQPTLALYGGPGFVAQVEHKLRAYTWNVVPRWSPPLLLEVFEAGLDGGGAHARFSSRSGFAREHAGPWAPAGDVLFADPLLRVRGRFVDHGTPCLAFVVEERARVQLARDRLLAAGLRTGPWLQALKAAVRAGAPDATPIDVRWRDREGEHATTRPLGELRGLVLDIAPGQRIGYVTDLCCSEANVQALQPLLAGVDRLFIESAFLHAERDHAERKHHLTARQAGEIARRVGARAVQSFHFSPRYRGREALLAAEVQAAWAGTEDDPN